MPHDTKDPKRDHDLENQFYGTILLPIHSSGPYTLTCNLLRPLIKILFLLVPCGYIIIRIKKNGLAGLGFGLLQGSGLVFGGDQHPLMKE